nr:M48 family metalloprotease [Paracoccaceae bacterium]
MGVMSEGVASGGLRRAASKASAILLLLSVAAGCASTLNPATGQRQYTSLSQADEQKIGAQEHPKVLKEFGGVYDDPEISGYVAQLGGRLAANSELPNQKWTFTVLDSPIVNAFALPGGYIYISRGLMSLANSEAELAGVLGHEIGHVTGRHTAQR